MKVYQVNDFPTLNGEFAGPEEVANYLAFEPGDLVVVESVSKKGVAEAIRLSDKLSQELDIESLDLIGKGLKLSEDYLRGVYR